jgi:hypothetical protein
MKTLFLISLVLLNGCSSLKFNTNAGGYANKKVQDNARQGSVKSYNQNEIWALNASQMGLVETNYCQLKFNDRKPSTNKLVSSLKVKTQKLGGNALVFDACVVNNSTASCHSRTRCRGMAYLIKY